MSDVELLSRTLATAPAGAAVTVADPLRPGASYVLTRTNVQPFIRVSWAMDGKLVHYINKNTWSIDWLGGQVITQEQIRRLGIRIMQQRGPAEQAARTVLAAIFAGRDLSNLSCGQVITSRTFAP